MKRRRKLKGSYTVEAAFIMGILLLAVTQGILWTYRQKDAAVCAMMLEEAVELIRYDRESPLAEKLEKGLEADGCRIRVTEQGGRLEGTAEKNGQIRKLSMERFEPETFLRMVSVIEEMTENEDSISAGDQAQLSGH